jgi:RNA polymerase sigma-70 factor (ECF subfamily)
MPTRHDATPDAMPQPLPSRFPHRPGRGHAHARALAAAGTGPVGRPAAKLARMNTGADTVAGPLAAVDQVEAAGLEQFLAGVGARAFRFAESSLRHREDAMDAVQEAMMKMLAYRDRPAGEWTPLFWSILRSRIIDQQRRRTFRLGWLGGGGAGGEDAGIEWADDGPDPSRAHDGREAYSRLAQALRGLPRRQREAFTLRVLEEFDVADTARIMDCSEGSVKTHLSRARAALQKQLEDFA